MSYLCSVCGKNAVAHDGDICPDCASTVDPFAAAASGKMPRISTSGDPASTGEGSTRRIAFTAEKTKVSETSSRHILSDLDDGEVDAGLNRLSANANDILSGAAANRAPAVVSAASSPVTTGQGGLATNLGTSVSGSSSGNSQSVSAVFEKGIAKNIVQDTDRRGVIWRWGRSLFKGATFALDPDITEFQLYPDFSGQTLNSSGALADQVVIYGKIKWGMISENNDVEVYGRRDADGSIVAKQVKNVATGATAKASMTMSHTSVLIATLIMVALVALIWVTCGPQLFLDLGMLALFIILLPILIPLFLVIIGFIFQLLLKAL